MSLFGGDFFDRLMDGMSTSAGFAGLGLAWDIARATDDLRGQEAGTTFKSVVRSEPLIGAATSVNPNIGSGVRAVRDGVFTGATYAMRGIGTPFTYATTAGSGALIHLDRWREGQIGLFDGAQWTRSLDIAYGGKRATGLGLDTLKQQWNITEDWNPDGVSVGEAFTALQDNVQAPAWLVPVAASQKLGQTTGLIAKPEDVEDIDLNTEAGVKELKKRTRGVWNEETQSFEGGDLKTESGYADLVIGTTTDPLNILGPVAKVGRAATLGKAVTTSEDVVKIASKIDAHKMAVDSAGQLGEYNEFGRFVEWTAKPENTPDILRRDPRFQKSERGQQLADILGRVQDYDTAAMVIKGAYGDEAALAGLKDYSLRFQQMLEAGQKLDEAEKYDGLFQWRPRTDDPLRFELSTPWGVAEDVDDARRLFDEVIEQESDLAQYLDDIGWEYKVDGDRLGRTTPALQQQPSPIRAVEKARENRAVRRAQKTLQPRGLGTVDYQPTRWDKIYRVVTWAGDEVPSGWIDFNRADSDMAFAAELRGAGKIRGTEYIDDASRQYWYDQFLAARGESAKRDVVLRFEQQMVGKLAERHGVDVDEAMEAYRQYHWARQSAFDAASRTGALPEADGVINLMPAKLRTSMVNSTTVMDFRALDAVLRRRAMNPGARLVAETGDTIGHAVAEAYDLMKVNVLLRFGYPIRNVTDSTLRSMAQLGAAAVWAPVIGGQVANNWARNRALGVQKMAWERAVLRNADRLKGDEAELVALWAEQDALRRVGDTALDTLTRDVDQWADELYPEARFDWRPDVEHPAATMTRDRWVRNRRNHPESYKPWAEAQAAKDGYVRPDLRGVPQYDDLPPAAGDYFHGSSQPLDNLGDWWNFSQSQNLMGAGFYTTDDVGVARTYTKKGGGKNPSLSKIRLREGVEVRALDADSAMPDEIGDIWLGGRPLSEVEGSTLAEKIKAYREEAAADGFVTRAQVDEEVGALSEMLLERGYNAVTYKGGVRTGNKRHTATVFLDPRNDLEIVGQARGDEVSTFGAVERVVDRGFTGDLRMVQQTREQGKAIGNWYKSARSVQTRHVNQFKSIRDANPDLSPEEIAAKMRGTMRGGDREALIAFEHFRRETLEQYQYMTDELGIQVEVLRWDDYAPYDAEGVEAMVDRLVNERKIYVLSTEDTGGHPFLTNDENDMFRAVHDVFGHAAAGRKFDRHGEEAAYVVHSQMYSDAALPALVPETRGQNAYLNYVSNGEFGPQKIVAAPPEFATRQPAAVRRHRDHEEYVVEALSKGQRVPEEVLEEYPHLKGREQLIRKAKNRRYTREAGIRITPENLAEMVDRSERSGGFTFDPRTGKFLESGWAVARNPKVEADVVEEIRLDPELVSPKELQKIFEPVLPAMKDDYLHLGGWFDKSTGELVFEIADVLPPEYSREAMRLGKARGQKAIYDLDNGVEVDLVPRSELPNSGIDSVQTTDWMLSENTRRIAELEARLDPATRAKLAKQFDARTADTSALLDEANAELEQALAALRVVEETEGAPRHALGQARMRVAKARRQQERASYMEQLRAEKRRELSQRARIGTGNIEQSGYVVAGAYGDDMGRVMADQASADQYRAAQFASTVQTLVQAAGEKNVGTVLPQQRGYYEAWADAVNRHVRLSPVAQKLLANEPPGKVAAWLERTPEGRRELRKIDMGIGDDVEGYVTRVEQLVDELTMGDRTFRAHIADGPVHATTLKDRFPLGTEGLKPIQGNVIAESVAPRNLSELTKTVVGSVMHFLGTLPEDRFARHPFYARSYENHMRQAIGDADGALLRRLQDAFGDGSREALEAKAKAAGWDPARYRLTSQELLDLQRGAHERALTELRSTLYSVVRRNNFAQAVRFLSPFYLAWENSIKTWGRLVGENPQTMVWATRAYNAPNKAGTVVDDEGNRVDSATAPGGGESIVFNIPKAAIAKLPNWFGIRDGLESAPQQLIPKDSLNMILQGEYWWQPGASWFVTIPADQLVRNQYPQLEEDLKILLGPGGVSSSGAWYDKLLSGWQRRLLQRTQEDSTVWMNTYNQIAKVEYAKYEMGERDELPTPAELMDRTRGLLAARVAFSAVLPYAPQQRDEFALYRDEYRRLLEENDGNVQKAEEIFYEKYGDEYFTLGTVSLSQNNTGAQATVGAFRNSKRYEDLIASVVGDDPTLVGLLVNDPDDSEYSNAVYRWQYGRPVAPGSKLDWRSGRSADDVKAEGERKLGWMKWNKLQEEIRLELDLRGLESTRNSGAEDLRAAENYWRDKLQQDLPGWRDDYKSFDGAKSAKRISALRTILSDEKFVEANGDDPVWRSTATMVQLYDEIQAELRKRRAADPLWPATLESEQNEDLAAAWDYWTKKLTMESTQFADVYDRYFSAIKVEVN